MILTTTPQIEGHTIREYKGIVTGETIIGANFVKDFFAGIRQPINRPTLPTAARAAMSISTRQRCSLLTPTQALRADRRCAR